MKFRAEVEPAERMKGLEVPPEVVDALGGGKWPPVIITVNGHSWKSRVAIMRGRFLLGLSNANRQAGGSRDRLAYSHKRQHVLAVEGAKKPETRGRRIEQALEMLREQERPQP